MTRLRAGWDRFWYAPEAAGNLAAARVVLALSALWVIASRNDLPSVLSFPAELWAAVTPERRLRFGMVLPLVVERALYALLHATLLAAALGIRARAACFASGLLLYHFAPFETIIRSANPYLRGLTLPALGLLLMSFGRCGDALALWPRPAAAPPPSPEYRWPLRAVQLLVCQMYLFAGYSKLFWTGWSWADAENVRGHLLVLNQALVAPPSSSAGYALAASPLACALLGWSGLLFELAFPLVLVSATARRVLVPAAAAFHAANSILFRIFFQNVPLLLLFVDWDALRGRARARA